MQVLDIGAVCLCKQSKAVSIVIIIKVCNVKVDGVTVAVKVVHISKHGSVAVGVTRSVHIGKASAETESGAMADAPDDAAIGASIIRASAEESVRFRNDFFMF